MAAGQQQNPLVIAGALIALAIAAAVWYQDYNSPLKTCIRAGKVVRSRGGHIVTEQDIAEVTVLCAGDVSGRPR